MADRWRQGSQGALGVPARSPVEGGAPAEAVAARRRPRNSATRRSGREKRPTLRLSCFHTLSEAQRPAKPPLVRLLGGALSMTAAILLPTAQPNGGPPDHTLVGRRARRSASRVRCDRVSDISDRGALAGLAADVAAQFALFHACWLLTYPLAGWLGSSGQRLPSPASFSRGPLADGRSGRGVPRTSGTPVRTSTPSRRADRTRTCLRDRLKSLPSVE